MIDEDHCIYFKSSRSKFVIMTLYVDDILISRTNRCEIVDSKSKMNAHFDMRDLEDNSHI